MFGFLEPEKEKEKRNEAECKEDWAAAVMQRAVDDVGIPVGAGHGEEINAEGVAKDAKREDSEGEDGFLRRAAEKKMASNETRNEKNET